ncbi:MAG: hypothetical protein BroJett021_26010 [Chloroflexota bacterium]|nr:hypothetical protein [Caldilinea sp.]GIK73613.1 MAG: hypothetical protein BroJett021_26010 [Chloroflexota bacterium]
MSNNEEVTIRPYKVQRVCEPQLDIERLVLKPVDSTESVYSRLLVKLKDAALPTSQYASEFGGPGKLGENAYPWDLFLMLKYRQDWKPSGYGLGDLIYTVSLLPNEELTLEVKTWETSKTQQDEDIKLESFQKSDIKSSRSSSSENTTENQTKEKEYVDAKAGYSGFGFSASVSAGWSQDVSTLNRNIAKQTQEGSNQATNEYRASRQVKMAVSRETGSEAKTTRKIKNSNQFHTLNVNYFQVLREYTVTLNLYDVSLVILGKAPYLDVPFYLSGLSNKTTTIKEMIEASQTAQRIQAFVQKYGVSPVLTLRQLWTNVLWEGALVDRLSIQYPANDKDRNAFRNAMLQYVRPTPGWVEPDNEGVLRWGYEILPDQVAACLTYLYQFVPYDLMQMTAVLVAKGLSQDAAMSSLLALKPGESLRLETKLVPRNITRILVPGPFHNVTIKDFQETKLPQWVQHIVDQYQEAQKQKGPVAVDGQPSWKTTLPTQGVWADLGLGICSGGEDYYEIQRQFDLELKRMEIEKLQLEVEKLRLENQALEQGKPPASVVIKNPTDSTSINLDFTIPKTGAEVEIKKVV